LSFGPAAAAVDQLFEAATGRGAADGEQRSLFPVTDGPNRSPPSVRFRPSTDPMTAMAAIDRLVHHSVILEFGGESHRSKAKTKPLKTKAP